MQDSVDKKELLEELRRISSGLKARTELFGHSGVLYLPKAKRPEPCASGLARYDGGPEGFGAFAPCARHPLWGGVAFGCWTVGSAAAIWGAPVSGPNLAPFSEDGLLQLGRMLNWLAGEIKAQAPDMDGFRLIAAGRCIEGGELSVGDAGQKALPAIESWLAGTGVKTVLLLGESARAAFMPGVETPLGKGFASKGRKFVATLPPDEIAASQALKKEAHAHLKALILSIQP